MVARFRLSLLLVAGCFIGQLACRGENYVVIPRDDAGSAVSSAVWIPEDDQGTSIELDAGGQSIAPSTPGEESDAAALPTAIPCTADAQCLDADPCNGIESCDHGYCLPGMPVACSDGNPCTSDRCDSSTGACLFNLVANGVPCGAVDKCDGQVCLEGFCTPGPAPVCPGDNDACSHHACDPATGQCMQSKSLDGTPCDDTTVCNGHETCLQGVCHPGTPLSCANSNACTIGSCDAVAGCLNTPLGDGTSCSDGNLCNGAEKCQGGVCRAGNSATCEDFNPCTTDVCDPITGACHAIPLANGTPCPDSNLCDGQRCQEGVCVTGSPVVCARDNDNNPCTTTSCNPSTGACSAVPVPDGTACPDGDLCDGTETCQSGVCAVPGTPLSCPDDGNPCTTDLCAPAAGCLHLNVADGTACPDADGCDGTETCTAGHCSDHGTPVVCNDSNPCTNDLCISLPGATPGAPPTGICTPVTLQDGTSCSNGDPCDGNEVCASGTCQPGVPKNCSDNNPCTADTCTPGSGLCVNAPVTDGIVCGQTDACIGTQTCNTGVCVQNAPVTCVAPAVCNSASGQCQ